MQKSILSLSIALVLTACSTAPNTTTTPPITWDKQYGGADKAYDTRLLTLREQIAPRFEQLEFKDPVTGKTMAYNLYTPKHLDPNKKYPLVMFIADASTVGKGVKAPLMQGYGGIIWATDESQAKHPAFVLVPSFAGPKSGVNDQWETTEEVGMALRLLKQTIKDKPVDDKRVYTTGQSMGGMISFYLNVTEPDLFAASMFVGSQWDTTVLESLKNQKFIYTVSAGDPKASKGMMALEELFKQKGIGYAKIQFAANESKAQQDVNVNALLKEGSPHNFIMFTKDTTLPAGVTADSSKAGEHMYSFDYAYLLEPARDWLFAQSK